MYLLTACLVVSQACQRHKTAPTASAALGRALVGTLLMGSFKEEGERTQVTFKGDGILGSMQVCSIDSSSRQMRNMLVLQPLDPDSATALGRPLANALVHCHHMLIPAELTISLVQRNLCMYCTTPYVASWTSLHKACFEARLNSLYLYFRPQVCMADATFWISCLCCMFMPHSCCHTALHICLCRSLFDGCATLLHKTQACNMLRRLVQFRQHQMPLAMTTSLERLHQAA